ncbi:MAG: hypothetical protein HYW49_02510 [Deltaproteobacteria bacterium]|nr:hypothetical protein [Deltaproteobacteria bacterium]
MRRLFLVLTAIVYSHSAAIAANCSLTTGSDYWLCRGITEKDCSLAKYGSDNWLCRGITEKNCELTSGNNYWLCKGITDNPEQGKSTNKAAVEKTAVNENDVKNINQPQNPTSKKKKQKINRSSGNSVPAD